jgi:endoglucanase
MRPDRRVILQAFAAIMTTTCGFRSEAELTEPASSPGMPVEASATFKSLWENFKARRMTSEGRIVDDGNNGISHSEGQGYAMVFAVAAGDKDGFRRLHDWTLHTLARPDAALHSWLYDPSRPDPLADTNNATDGDLLIAWALALAGRSWDLSSYRDRAVEIQQAIRDRLFAEMAGRLVLLPGLQGFHHEERIVFNPAYFIWSAFRTFAEIGDPAFWNRVTADSEWLLDRSVFGPLQLPSDWCELTSDGLVQPAEGWSPRFGYDAIRIPIYRKLDDRAISDRLVAYWESFLAYDRMLPAWIDVMTGETPDYGLSAGGLAAVASITERVVSQPVGPSDYYSDALELLVELARS